MGAKKQIAVTAITKLRLRVVFLSESGVRAVTVLRAIEPRCPPKNMAISITPVTSDIVGMLFLLSLSQICLECVAVITAPVHNGRRDVAFGVAHQAVVQLFAPVPFEQVAT